MSKRKTEGNFTWNLSWISIGCLNLELHSCNQTLGLDTVCNEITDRNPWEWINLPPHTVQLKVQKVRTQAMEEGWDRQVQDRQNSFTARPPGMAWQNSHQHRASSPHWALFPEPRFPTPEAPALPDPSEVTGLTQGRGCRFLGWFVQFLSLL